MKKYLLFPALMLWICATPAYAITVTCTNCSTNLVQLLDRITNVEQLTNAIKHAGQVRVTIRVSVTSREVRLLVANGRPATSDEDRKHTEGHGITGMRERVRALGGRIDIGPDPTTSGWRVSASLPWRAT